MTSSTTTPAISQPSPTKDLDCTDSSERRVVDKRQGKLHCNASHNERDTHP
ncbi:hypothetical protein [Amycolatopsis sp. NBC_01480]|uniref:hypothetical protein n=1 Tax=Amycolatopsis sp. NBC_01480 TaxID=2903562 RepID=UPI002E2DA8EF|nr:hypothetical protein [Amycolatopsis sp. NBC_01480]